MTSVKRRADPAPPAEPPRHRLLLVEDNPGDADLARDRLADGSDDQFDVVHASDLETASEIVRTSRIDAVILDLNLPDSQGVGTLESIRALNADMAVVVLSGQDDAKLRDRTMLAGAEDFIGKNESSGRTLARSVSYAMELNRTRQRERQIDRLVAATPDAVIVADENGLVRFANDATLRLFARSREDFLGTPLGYPLNQDRALEIEIPRDGDRRTAEMRVSHFDWHGHPAFLAILRDVTDKKADDERIAQAQKMEAVGQLAGGIAHDFNNLLTVILSYANFVRDDLLPGDPHRSDIEELIGAGERAATLTDQLLSFSRRRSIKPEVVDPAAAIGAICKLLKRTFPATIETSVIAEAPPWPVWVDPSQFEQVFMNLAVNARDAMPGGGRLTFELQNVVRTHATDILPAGEYVSIAVRDSGHGMPAEIVSKAFEPFFTTKGVGKGTGLGLAMCHGIVRQAAGDICIESKVGEGTTVTALLARSYGTPGSRRSDVLARPSVRGTERILVVEDNPGVLRSTTRILEGNGYTVFRASNGDEGRRLLSQESVDLVISDLVMPQMGGSELAAHLQATHPTTRILLMSGYADAAAYPDSDSGRDEVVADMLSKPFSPDELLQKVRGILDRS